MDRDVGEPLKPCWWSGGACFTVQASMGYSAVLLECMPCYVTMPIRKVRSALTGNLSAFTVYYLIFVKAS